MKYFPLLALIVLMTWNCDSFQKQSRPEVRTAEFLYNRYCKGCHGRDGSLGFDGASDLRLIRLDKEEAISRITEGKGRMAAYKKYLTEEEIALLANYITRFQKN